jgi:hypothetical protein
VQRGPKAQSLRSLCILAGDAQKCKRRATVTGIAYRPQNAVTSVYYVYQKPRTKKEKEVTVIKGNSSGTNMKIAKMDMKVMFSTLWIVVMINVAMADIFGFMMDSMAGNTTADVQIPQIGMLIFAIIMEIPIAMIILSRVLKYGANRWANIIASVITMAFVVLGGSANLVYGFFATVEIVCMLIIIWKAWKWTNPQA